MGRFAQLVASVFVAITAVFLAWSPSADWQEEHFTDEPFEWPASLPGWTVDEASLIIRVDTLRIMHSQGHVACELAHQAAGLPSRSNPCDS